MLSRLIERLESGFEVAGTRVAAARTWRGRFPEEVNLDLHVEGAGHLCFVKVYKGWGRYYRPWVELSGITEPDGSKKVRYYGGPIEEALLSVLAEPLGPAGRLFVSYAGDLETARALQRGAPPASTRLGSKLFALGFTWFKDWYFPEGFKEGGEKLQAEKPASEQARARHLGKLREELEAFVAGRHRGSGRPARNDPLASAAERARRLLEQIGRQ